MELKRVRVTYNPDAPSTVLPWEAENPVVVTPGITAIEWTVHLANPGQQGTIRFGTEPNFQGIDFGGRWPGTEPRGGEHVWLVVINDKLEPGDKPKNYHYTINTWYRSDALTPPTKQSWDPDVEEDPKN